MEVDNILPQKDSDLMVPLNRIEIINFLIGDYLGFYLDRNNYLIPIFFGVINNLGEIKFKVNNINYRGIGRITLSQSLAKKIFHILIFVTITAFRTQFVFWTDACIYRSKCTKTGKYYFGNRTKSLKHL